jgi:IS4 transposase
MILIGEDSTLTVLPSNIDPHEIEKTLNKMFSPEWLRETAARVGYIQRERKIDPATLFWVLVLGFGVGAQRTLASLRRAYEKAAAETLVPSAFYYRFNGNLVDFLKECLAHGIADLASCASLTLSDKLQGFKDIIVADGTIIKLHERLARQFPGARSKAELKIHTAIGLTGNTKTIGIFPGKTAEIKTIRIGPWIKDQIMLFDLGYFKYELFSRIRKNEGHFVSRLKTTANPTVVSVLRSYRGQPIDLAGKKLQDVLPRLKREVIDVEIEVAFRGASSKAKQDTDETFEVYNPKGTPRVKETFRLVGIFDKESNAYHLYLTSLSPQQLSAEDVALLYRARWSIELIFKELKRLYKLDVISSGAPDTVEALVLVAMLTLVVSHRVLNQVRLLDPDRSARYTPLRWGETFFAAAPTLMSQTLKYAGIEDNPTMILLFLMDEGVDPNVHRKRLLSQWVKANSQGLNASK